MFFRRKNSIGLGVSLFETRFSPERQLLCGRTHGVQDSVTGVTEFP